MTLGEIIMLIVVIIACAVVLGSFLSSGKEDKTEIETFPEYTAEEAANIKAAEEAYNKPIVEIEVNEPEFVAKVVSGVDEAPVTVELQVERKAPKSEFPIDKPKAKKKYPRKKKPSKVQE
jgi:flagellar basal body-associated protein FliL